MAVDVNITPIGSGFNRTTINDNFVAIDAAFQQVLGRAGTTPNSMNADIDLNSNDLLNVGDINTQRLFVDGVEFVTGDVSQVGERGWSPSLAVKDDGARRVLQLVEWVGGQGTSPSVGVGEYIGISGFEPLIANGVDIRGPQGASGVGTGDMLSAQNLNDVADKPTSFNNIKQPSTLTYSGVVELATDAETITGIDDDRAVTPAGLAATLAAFSSPSDVQIFTSSGTWNKPSFGTFAYIEMWGGGGSGGNGGGGDAGGGGGGGAHNDNFFLLSTLTSSVSVTVGTGGAAIGTSDTDGVTGGTTTFGAYLSAYGGGGGRGVTSVGGGGGGGGGRSSAGLVGIDAGSGGNGGSALGENVASGGLGIGLPSINGGASGGADSSSGGSSWNGGGGGGGGNDAISTGGAGGSSMYGGGGGGGWGRGSNPGPGGTSTFGGNGGAGGVAGSIPAGGGGGTESGFSGAGGRGECRIYVW